MKRLRLWLGMIGLVTTSYLIFDPAERFALAWATFTEFGPYALAALALVNLARALTRSVAAYIGPGILATIAAIVALRPAVSPAQVTNIAFAVVFVGAVALATSAVGGERPWTRVMWSGRVAALNALRGQLRAVAVLGEIRVDMLGSQPHGQPVLTAVAFGGRVVVDVPREWRVLARPPAGPLLLVRESGRRELPDTDGHDLEVRLIGFGGALELRRS
ncbi:hypothetical protein [Micromonospora humi]|uniref:Uncharacterized protein n=1 Tax=Micromonospora humi TaxID=745366 RepID=A0A1C5GLQ1_9ACTN|nr:hypothetical protein [Micromonospora humi]SCG34730.1 hypothetical protein GA0070213_101270 [Micromonospora humi]